MTRNDQIRSALSEYIAPALLPSPKKGNLLQGKLIAFIVTSLLAGGFGYFLLRPGTVYVGMQAYNIVLGFVCLTCLIPIGIFLAWQGDYNRLQQAKKLIQQQNVPQLCTLLFQTEPVKSVAAEALGELGQEIPRYYELIRWLILERDPKSFSASQVDIPLQLYVLATYYQAPTISELFALAKEPLTFNQTPPKVIFSLQANLLEIGRAHV